MLSIIIPTYNRLTVLKRCVESVVSQSYPGLELIVVDDGSTDHTRQWLDTVQQEHAFIRVIYSLQNYGVNYARNRGIERASQPYILFLDSDEHLLPGALAEVIAAIEGHPKCRFFLFLQADRWLEFSKNGNTRTICYADWLRERIGGDFIHVVETAILKKYLFFEQFSMFEYLNWLRIKKATSSQLLKPVVIAARETGRADSLTRKARLNNLGAIQAQFESKQLFYSLYSQDLRDSGARSLGYPLLKVILLGIACNRKAASRRLVRHGNGLHIRIVGTLITLVPGKLVRKCILTYTANK